MMSLESTTRRKRVKLAEGDLFEFAISDGRLGYGIIIRRGALKNGGTPYIALFHGLYDERPDLEQLARVGIALAGWTMDGLFYHGQWNVIWHDVALPVVPFPNFKVGMGGKFYVTDVDGNLIDEATPDELELLDHQFSRTPTGFQNAFEAMHGLKSWTENDEKLTPVYAEARVTRSSSKYK